MEDPDKIKPVLKLIFDDIENYRCEEFEEYDPDHIDSVIGFELTKNGYVLHTDTKEIIFEASKEPRMEPSNYKSLNPTPENIAALRGHSLGGAG
ncbi:MAG: hypothetical protein ACI9SC_002028 [Gammaproteobacteria bacterium]